MEKKTLKVAIVTLAFLFSLVAGMEVGNMAKANPYHYEDAGEVEADANTNPPIIAALSPTNNSILNSKSINLSINVSIGNSSTASVRFILNTYYSTDWQRNSTYIYEYIPPNTTATFQTTLNLTNLTEGKHEIVIYATERGNYQKIDPGSAGFVTLYYNFQINGSSSFFFTVDTTQPRILTLSIENRTYNSPKIPFTFNTDEISQTSYSLDNNENVTLVGNTTLTGLANGSHSLIVYAKDTAGNMGKSDTIFFTIDTSTPSPSPSPSPTVTLIPTGAPIPTTKPSPTPNNKQENFAPLAVAAGLVVAVAVVTVLVYLKKRRG